MKIFVINNHGAGFADTIEVSEGTTIKTLFHQTVPHASPQDYLIRLNRGDGAADYVPTLRLSPYAWSKLLFLRDLGDTEVGGFGISSNEDLFLIEDFRLIKQRTTFATVKFDDEAVADFFDEQVDSGRQPERCGRCWIHTHPGDSADPSGTDEQTFARAFGGSSWSMMFILARGGEAYARLQFGCGPGAELMVSVEIAWDVPFLGTDHEAWEREYDQCVKPVVPPPLRLPKNLTPEDAAFLEENPGLLEEFGFPWLEDDDLEMERNMALHDSTDEFELL